MKLICTLFILLLQLVSFGQKNTTPVLQENKANRKNPILSEQETATPPIPFVAEIVADNNEIMGCSFTDQVAYFPGEMKALMAFIRRNLVFPEADNLPKGDVIVGFCIQKDGSVVDIEILKSLEKRLDQSVIDVMKKVPKWYPEVAGGIRTEVKYVLPVSFPLPIKNEK